MERKQRGVGERWRKITKTVYQGKEDVSTIDQTGNGVGRYVVYVALNGRHRWTEKGEEGIEKRERLVNTKSYKRDQLRVH